MKKLLFSLIFTLILISTSISQAKSVRVEFTSPPDTTWKTWVLYSLVPNIADRINNGTVEEETIINGQISKLGETFVEAGGFISGETYYFTAIRVDLNGNKSGYAEEVVFPIPENEPFYFEPLPNIEINGHVFTLEIILKQP